MNAREQVSPSQSESPSPPLRLRIGFWACTLIAISVVLRRVSALAYPPHNAPPQLAALDAVFASHAALTLAHILPALVFVILAPFVVFRRPANSQWPERFILPLGAVVGLTAFAMSAYPVGGRIEQSAVFVFNSLFLFSLLRAFLHLQRHEPIQQRKWTLRAIAILLGIATTRPVMGVFFATSPLTHLAPNQFFGIAFWIGFSINTLAFELWLRSRDRPQPSPTMVIHPSQ
jgi:Predicted membrane protein (DUF2306)